MIRLKRILMVAVFACIGSSAMAQVDQLFWSVQYTVFADMVWSPLVMENAPTGNTIIQDGKEVAEFRNIPVQSFINNILSGGVEVRYNLFEFSDNQALGISIPLNFGIGQVTQPPNMDGRSHAVASTSGYGSIQLPVMAKLYTGLGSTRSDESATGFSIGFGIEYNKLGLVRFQQSEVPAPDGKSGFAMPVGSLSYHFLQGGNPVEFRIKYGRGPLTEYFVDRYGDPIRNSQGIISSGLTRAQSISLCFSYLLNN